MRVPSRLFAETFARIGDPRATGAALGMKWGAVRVALSRLREPKEPKQARPLSNRCGGCKVEIKAQRKFCPACCPIRRVTADERAAIEAAYQAGETHTAIAARFGRSVGSISAVTHTAIKAGRVSRHKTGRPRNG